MIFLKIIAVLLCLFILYLLAVNPHTSKRLSGFSSNFAHRGLHGKLNGKYIAENSLPAFRAACDKNFGIELDVRLSKDGIPMVFHDANLERMCQINGKISEFTSAGLSESKLCGGNDTIPTLEQTLALVDGKVPLLIEIKGSFKISEICAETAKLLDLYNGSYYIEAFSPLVLRWFYKHRPQVMRGQLAELFSGNPIYRLPLLLPFGFMCFNFLSHPDFIAFNYKHHRFFSFVILKRLYRIPAVAWTLKNQRDASDAEKYFDAIIFESFLPH